MKILVAYDGSRFAEAAIDELLDRPWPQETEVRLVTAIEPLGFVPSAPGLELFTPFGERLDARLREDCYKQIQQALSRLSARPELTTSYEIREGEAKHALLAAIRDWQPDLVLAGSHGKSPFERLLLGSVSHALVSHAPCSVEIVRAAAVA
jgi:nucleotide-binding universal stress UspA family protein